MATSSRKEFVRTLPTGAKRVVKKHPLTVADKKTTKQRDRDPAELQAALAASQTDDTDEQVERLRELADEIQLCWDEDCAENVDAWQRKRVFSVGSQGQYDFIANSLNSRPEYLPPATGLLLPKEDWRLHGGRLASHAVPYKSHDTSAGRNQEPPLVLYDFADVVGVNPHMFGNHTPSRQPIPYTKQVYDKMFVYAEKQGIQIGYIYSLSSEDAPGFRSGIASPTLHGFYRYADKALFIHPSLPLDRRTTTLAHELGHAYDTPLHLDGRDRLSAADKAVEDAKDEIVAEMSQWLVSRKQRIDPYPKSYKFIQQYREVVAEHGSYEEVEAEIADRVFATADAINAGLARQ